MSEHYDFHYQPTGSGAISGQQVLEQTEDAINELGDYVNDNVGGAMDVAQQALETAQTAETNAQTALNTANSFSDAIQSAQQDASTALSTAQTAQTTASNANNTAIQASQDASSAVTTANNASSQVSTLSGTVTALGQRVTTAEGNIGQNTSDITALTTRVGTAEDNITTLQNNVTIAQGNASSAMTTAGTVKQQSYVLRYSSTTLVAFSTNSNSLLDNTDNLKVGDKVIDSSGVIYSVTAIDTANSTFTIGTSLIDLAQDSDVVHKSGNETIAGVKSFSDDTYVKNINFTKEVASSSVSTTSILQLINTVTYTDETASKVATLNFRITADGVKAFYPNENNQYALGLQSRKWSEVRAIQYYYGSSDTEFSDKFVTTDTNQTVSGSKTFSGNVLIHNSDTSVDARYLILKNQKVKRGSTTETGTQFIAFHDKDSGTLVSYETNVSSSGNTQAYINVSNVDANSQRVVGGVKVIKTPAETWFIPDSDNTVSLGLSNYKWKDVYATNYYLGSTAFGDIVTHNASEFLTSHQSLSSCVKNVVTNSQTIKSTAITRGTAPSSAQTFGIAFSDNNNKYIGNIYGQYATDKSTYVGLYAYKGTTTANGDNASVRVGYDASGNAYTYAPTPATADNSTQIATTAFVKAQGYLTSHQSLANYVTTNTDQSISGIKSHSKHISILGDYIGNESSTNGRSCLYLKANRDTDGKSGLYVTKFRQNVAQGSMGSSDVVFLSHDILENETRTNAGFVESYSNWEDDVPKGISVYSTIATRNLGTSAKPWTNTYAVNFYENGTALSSKYALNENLGKGTTTYLYIKSADFPTGSGTGAYIQYNDVVDGTKLYVWYSVCNSSSILDIKPTATKVTSATGQVWRYLGPTIYAASLGHDGASPTGILGLFRRES